MEDKMVAGAFGRARNYGWDGFNHVAIFLRAVPTHTGLPHPRTLTRTAAQNL